MLSLTQMVNQFTTLSQNNTTANQALAATLINQQHKYLLLKYFDNEKQTTITTVGPQTLAITTATLAAGSKSATLTAQWTYPTCEQLVVFSDGEELTVKFIQNSTAISWNTPTKTIQTSASLACVGVQSYPIPANVSKIKNATITIGQLVYTPAPVQSIQEWTKLNALPYTAAYPAYFYMYDNHLNFFPIPSATGNVITIYCQIIVPDLTYADNVTGTILTVSAGSNAITGTATTFGSGSGIPTGTDIGYANIFFSATPPKGDGLFYQVQSIASDTALTLYKPVVYAPTATGGTLTLGQYPLLAPDFHDTIVYGALRTYFSSISKDTDKATYFTSLYQEKLQLMEFYLSTKQVNVDLSVSPVQSNANLYIFATPANP